MEAKNTIADRINQYLKRKGISRRAFCRDAGFDPSKINRQLKGESQLSADTIDGFVNTYHDFNVIWLILGEGPMLLTDVEDQPQPEPVPYNVSVKASAVADTTASTLQPSDAPQLDLSTAINLIKSQQDIIERQAAMLENLLKQLNQ